MTPKKVLKIFGLIVLIAFIGIMTWDVFLYSDDIPGNSITQAVIFYSHEYPIIAWFLGFFKGGLTFHFWG